MTKRYSLLLGLLVLCANPVVAADPDASATESPAKPTRKEKALAKATQTYQAAVEAYQAATKNPALENEGNAAGTKEEKDTARAFKKATTEVAQLKNKMDRAQTAQKKAQAAVDAEKAEAEAKAAAQADKQAFENMTEEEKAEAEKIAAELLLVINGKACKEDGSNYSEEEQIAKAIELHSKLPANTYVARKTKDQYDLFVLRQANVKAMAQIKPGAKLTPEQRQETERVVQFLGAAVAASPRRHSSSMFGGATTVPSPLSVEANRLASLLSPAADNSKANPLSIEDAAQGTATSKGMGTGAKVALVGGVVAAVGTVGGVFAFAGNRRSVKNKPNSKVSRTVRLARALGLAKKVAESK